MQPQPQQQSHRDGSCTPVLQSPQSSQSQSGIVSYLNPFGGCAGECSGTAKDWGGHCMGISSIVPVPHHLRGITYGQLRQLKELFVDDGWLLQKCKDFNDMHCHDPSTMERTENLYALDRFVVTPITQVGESDARVKATDRVPRALRQCSYAELLNPQGRTLHYFVSHWWGHTFAKTMEALSHWAKQQAPALALAGQEEEEGDAHTATMGCCACKSSSSEPSSTTSEPKPQAAGSPLPKAQVVEELEVTFWICLFALNQHQKAEEVGDRPERGPFNLALSSQDIRGALMILDDMVMPFKRAWCLYEVHRIAMLNVPFEILCEHGPLANAAGEAGGEAGELAARALEVIAAKVETAGAKQASCSSEQDKLAIWRCIADPYCRSLPDVSFLSEAAFTAFDRHIKSLLSGAIVEAALPRKDRERALHAAFQGAILDKDKFRALQELMGETALARCRRGGLTLLIVHVQHNHCDVVELLLAQGADLEATDDSKGRPALHHAAIYDYRHMAKLLLSKGADLEAVDAKGRQPLHQAAVGGHCDMAALLLSRGADLEASDKRGRRPLHHAAYRCHRDVAELLLASGARLDASDEDGLQPLSLAAAAGSRETAELLLARGSDLEAVSEKHGRRALHHAAAGGHRDVARLLLARGAELEACDHDGRRPSDLAAARGHQDLAELLSAKRGLRIWPRISGARAAAHACWCRAMF